MVVLVEEVVDGLQTGRFRLQDGGDVVGGGGDVGITDGKQRSRRWFGHQPQLRLQDRHARPLGAYEGAGEVRPSLGKELVKRVARDPAGDVGEAGSDQLGVAVPQGAQPGVDLAAPATFRRQPDERVVERGSEPEAKAVVRQHVERLDEIGRAVAFLAGE